MAVYSGRYSPYRKPRSGGSAFVEGLASGISQTLERRRQLVEQKRQEEMQKQAQQQLREFQVLMSQVGAVQRDPLNFAPSMGPTLQGQAGAMGFPGLAIPDIAGLGFQAAQQRGEKQRATRVGERQTKRRLDISERVAATGEKRAAQAGVDDIKPVFGDKEYDRDWKDMRKTILIEIENVKIGSLGDIFQKEPLTPAEQAQVDSLTTERTNSQWVRQGKTIPERVRGTPQEEFRGFFGKK